MLSLIDLRGHTPTTSELRRTLPRGGTDVNSVAHIVEPLLHKIHEHGAQAALDFGEKFDHVRPKSVCVPQDVIDAALDSLTPEVKQALDEAIARVRKVHADQKPQEHATHLAAGATVTEVFLPVERVGLYVPGGNAVYPSSVVMNVVPAQEAGVTSLVVASPPQAHCGGWPHPTILQLQNC